MRTSRHTLSLFLATSCLVATFSLPAKAMIPSAYEHFLRAVSLEHAKDYRGAEQEFRLTLGLDPYDNLTYIKLANLILQDDRKSEAIELYQKALALNPKDTMIHLSLGQVYEQDNKPLKALAEYQALTKSNPQYVYGYLSLARVEKSLGQTQQAVQDYQTFLKAYPSHYDAQRELAAILLQDKQYQKAASVYQSLKSQHADKFKDDLAYGIALNHADKSAEALAVFQKIKTPSAILYQQMGMSYEKLNRLPDAYQMYQKTLDMAPNGNENLYLKMADLASTMNEPDKAIENLTKYLSITPGNGKVEKSLGDLYLQKKDYPHAIEAYQGAMNHFSPEDSAFQLATLRNLGYAQQMNGQLDEAIKNYQKALAMQDNKQTRVNLALAYHQHQDYDQALSMYQELLRQDPQSPLIRKNMGQVLLALGDQAFKQKDYTTALNHYQEAYLLGGDQETPALLGLANTQYALNNKPVAYATFQRVLEKDPLNATARLNKAQLDLENQNYMEAFENLRWLTQNKPDDMDAYRLLAQTQETIGDYGQAILNYKKVLEVTPSDTDMLVGYGNVWREVGDYERAQQAYEMARDSAPNNPMVHYDLASIYNLRDNLDASLMEYQTSIQLDPNLVDSYYGMGTTLEKQKKILDAVKLYQEYVEKAPPSSSYVPMARERIQLLQHALTPASGAMVKSKTPKS